jgi:hypothetical protein
LLSHVRLAQIRGGRHFSRCPYVSTITPDADAGLLNAFRQALRETGFFEGQNVTIEYRWAENHVDSAAAPDA